MDHKILHGLRALCHHRMRPGGGVICYPAHDDVPMAMDGNDISIHTTVEMGKFESLCYRDFTHTRVYDANLFERVGLDKELPTNLQTIGWGKLYNEPHLGSPLGALVGH
jgi:hypothetical protein